MREVREETGVEVEPEGLVGDIKYWFSRPQEGVRYYKTVRHFLLRPIGGDPSLHDHEFDEVRWFQMEEALEMMTHATERSVVEEAAAIIARGKTAEAAGTAGEGATP
jgi:8-oxo-dGTP pyrophosphatase MutT (NUDIX family)